MLINLSSINFSWNFVFLGYLQIIGNLKIDLENKKTSSYKVSVLKNFLLSKNLISIFLQKNLKNN